MHQNRVRRLGVAGSIGALLLASTMGLSAVHAETPKDPKHKKPAQKTLAVTPPAKGKGKEAAKGTAKTASSKPSGKTATSAPPSKPLGFAPDPRPTGSVAAQAMPAFSGALGNLQQAMALVEKGDASGALDAADQLRDPGAQALVRWLALRVTARGVGFDRAQDILRTHPTLPTPTVLRRRLEYLLYAENRDPGTIRAFFAERPPISGEGKIAFARALFATGERQAGTAWLRDAWREDPLSEDVESTVMVEFSGLLTRADHKYRADKMLYAEDAARGLRAAERAGSDVMALAKARVALFAKGGDPATLLNAVPMSMRSDPAYIYTRAKILRRAGNDAAAASALASAPKDAGALVDPDEWWTERRLVSRELLDAGDYRTAYAVVRDAVPPEGEHVRSEAFFTAGWIALRFLNDPRTALQHFSRIPEGQTHPATIARGFYWQGRALEAMGSTGQARAQYDVAAAYGTTYYGQLARARIGKPLVGARAAPAAGPSQRVAFSRDEGVQIFKLLEQTGRRDLAIALASDLSERLPDEATLGLLGELAGSFRDARAMVVIGKNALNRGIPLEATAYPTIGIPSYQPIGPEIDRALIYAIARQESMFNAAIVSRAGATGLMQVMPATGRTIARREGVSFDPSKLHTDPATNVRFGAAELRDLLEGYQDNYVLTFAAYNAGRGNVSKWIAQYGDPRDPRVDPIDWVERIPYSETRNYVQRVMENAQVYKARFGGHSQLQIEADLRGARGVN
ncbi:lytic transglycosylase domain-containing protein [Ancylobacter sp. 6x-1]|uniref:Lytic transglycosylase domain-containing protein n=1 Tax=Ancylobacter crimeensis TaxID=2579147 RepID=A0ABT0D6V7_9HYPH|nr:lytic transglycosylase domain-containing protein [Ancylobacter crimeensis]MCK0195664.1 lytic transglycosylase domain-containing protein [Ancylobacter crimeensis]